jgi:[ribosomal protein S5]-alanine N-acetyltransferase
MTKIQKFNNKMNSRYSNEKVILEQLTKYDADFFYGIYSNPLLTVNFDESSFLPNEKPIAFTERIISLCECIFTIRPTDQPQLIIGDCALHHYNKARKEITIGGSLLPQYWGNGFMNAAFLLLEEIARMELKVNYLLGPTKTRNHKAIRFVEKLGFAKYKVDKNETVMRKMLDCQRGSNFSPSTRLLK